MFLWFSSKILISSQTEEITRENIIKDIGQKEDTAPDQEVVEAAATAAADQAAAAVAAGVDQAVRALQQPKFKDQAQCRMIKMAI